MLRRPLAAAIAAVATLGATFLTPVPGAVAAPETAYGYAGSAGGTFVNVLGGAVRSDLTAGSYLTGNTYPNQMSNTTVGVDVPGLLSAGVIETTGKATKTAGTTEQAMTAETARVSLLDGLITADVLATTTTATKTGDVLDGASKTRLVDLAIAGSHLPISVPANTRIEIPGIAEVTLNESVKEIESGNITVTGSALKVRLLKAIDGSQPGTVVTINPTVASLVIAQPADVTHVGGFAYATSVNADVLGAKVKSDPTSFISVPPTGTNGRTNVVSLARVTLPQLVEAGVLESTATATSVPRTADVTHTAGAARVKLLGGLVTADAVKVSAEATKGLTGQIGTKGSTEILNLRLLGLPVRLPVNKANIKVGIPGVLTITVNEQVITAEGITVTGLRVKLLKTVGQFPAGADVAVAVASSRIG